MFRVHARDLRSSKMGSFAIDSWEDSSRFETLPITTSRNRSSSSSVFFSANQSPFFSPRSPTCHVSESKRTDAQCDRLFSRGDPCCFSSAIPESLANVGDALSDMSRNPVSNFADDFQKFDRISSSAGMSNSTPYSYSYAHDNGYFGFRGRHRTHERSHGASYTPASVSHFSNRVRSCDVFIGLHGRKPSLLRFVDWLQAELEVQGISCFVSDRARCRNSRKQGIVNRAMDVSSFGILVLTKKSFRNLYTVEELLFFASKKNLVPLFFDLSPSDCLVRDIVEKRGELWEKHGGELWLSYEGLEQEWKEAVNCLSRVAEWKLEAHEGNWRDCILKAVSLLAMRLGRRSVVERVTRWREKVEKEEFPFPRNENFIGRKKELSELEFMLFGDVRGDSERDFFELKARPSRKNLTIGWSKRSLMDEKRKERQPDNDRKKGKEPVVWKESEKEIEMESTELSQRQQPIKPKSGGRYAKRKRSTKILYGKGFACVSGELGIGKTELLLEFAYRYHQRYKMVLWIGGESRYIRQNYMNLWSLLDVHVGVENCSGKSMIRNLEEQEEEAIFKVRKELMRNIPFLVIIDNLESEKDWWDHKPVMDLLPRFGGETHILISTRLSQVMNLEPLKLSYLSGVEAMSLMQGTLKDYSISEIDALRTIEEKVGRLTLGLALVGATLSELPISPSRLLDTINRMPLMEIAWSNRETHPLGKNAFLFQIFEVCFSIFDHADGPRSLATRMVQASGWFAPAAIPTSLLACAASKVPEKHRGAKLWIKLLQSLSCCMTSPYSKRSEIEATSMLLRFNLARSCTRQGHIYVNDLVKLYARKRGIIGVAQAMVQAVISRGSIFHHSEHVWAACFLLFGFCNDPKAVEPKVPELLHFVKEMVLPLAVRTFITFSRCNAALELLRLCTDALEVTEQAFVAPVEKWLDKSPCWKQIQTNAQLNPCLWQELALCRATVLETRAKLMLRGGQFDIGDGLIRKAIFIRTSICGVDHPDTVSARETLSKLTRLLANAQIHNSP